MKNYQLIITSLVAFGLFGCNEPAYIDAPGVNSHNQDSLPVLVDPDPTPDPEGFAVPDGTINVYEAVRISKKLKDKEVSEQKYFIKGWVTGFNRGNSFDSDFPSYGNDFVYISATNDGTSSKQFYAYRVLGKFGAKLPDLDCVQIGDFVVISCYPMNYGGTYESSGACFIYLSNNEHFNEVFPAFPGCPAPKENEISVTEAEKISMALENKATTTEAYKIRGVITSVTSVDTGSGKAIFNISDGLSYATCYQLLGPIGYKFSSADQIQVGDTVVVRANIQNFSGTCEPTSGSVIESTNKQFSTAFPEFPGCPDPKEGEISVSEAVTIAQALPNKSTSTESYKIRGVVISVETTSLGSYGNITFNISDGLTFATCFQTYASTANGKFTNLNQVQVGDTVLVVGNIQNYNGTCEPYRAYVKESTNANFNEAFPPLPPFPGCPEPGEGEISVNRAKAISDSIGTGKTTTEMYKIRAVVTSVSDKTLSSYGNMTFDISSDGDVTATCYRLFYKSSNNKFTNINQVQAGDTVLVNAKIQNYSGTCEPVQGYIMESTNPNF
ncbi:MAG: hypothetical protein IJ814_00155 [Paludibacteraceae bacterium]|nr:hypothetical protein [Paludibacteraceae bacterium]